jgi:hypothetical protein
MSAAGKPETMTFDAAMDNLLEHLPESERLWGPIVAATEKVHEAHARDLAAAFRRGQEEMREAAAWCFIEKSAQRAIRALPLRDK